MKKLCVILSLFVVASMALIACQAGSSSASTATQPPTATRTPAKTATPASTATQPPTATRTPAKTATQPPTATLPPTAIEKGVVVTDSGVTIYGAPDQAYPVRWAGTVQTDQECPLPKACNMIGSKGVLSANTWEEAQANPSAVWTGGADVDQMVTTNAEVFGLPEAGWLKATFGEGSIKVGPFVLVAEGIEGQNVTVVIRGNYEGEGDLNLPAYFSTNHPGFMKVMRYAVPAEHSGFFSYDHLLEDLMAGHETQNCGGGSDGCPDSILVLLDVNDGSYAVYSHTVAAGFTWLAGNAVAP